MASDSKGLTGTPWEDKDQAFPEPGLEGTTSGAERGGHDLGEGTEKESANSSGLPMLIGFTDVKDGPAPGSTAEVFPGVTSPSEVAGNIKGGDRSRVE